MEAWEAICRCLFTPCNVGMVSCVRQRWLLLPWLAVYLPCRSLINRCSIFSIKPYGAGERTRQIKYRVELSFVFFRSYFSPKRQHSYTYIMAWSLHSVQSYVCLKVSSRCGWLAGSQHEESMTSFSFVHVALAITLQDVPV